MFVYVNNLLWLFRMEPHTFEKKNGEMFAWIKSIGHKSTITKH